MNSISRLSARILIFLFFSGMALPLQNCPAAYAQGQEEELFLVAQKAFDDGFYDVAIRYIEQYLQQYPQTERSVPAKLLLGQCYFFQSQYLKAYDVFQGLLDRSEYKDATLFWLGETYFKGADYKRAESYYQQLIELFPQSVYIPQAKYSLGWSYFEQGKYAMAKKAFLKMLQQFPSHRLSEDAAFKLGECEYNLSSYQVAIDYFQNYIFRYPKSPRHAQAYFYVAEANYYQEDYLTAVTYYAKAADLAYDPNLSFMAMVSMGWSYFKLDKNELARKYFDQALELSGKTSYQFRRYLSRPRQPVRRDRRERAGVAVLPETDRGLSR